MKLVFKHQDLQLFGLKWKHTFHPLDVVCRDSETQYQVGEKCKLFNLAL